MINRIWISNEQDKYDITLVSQVVEKKRLYMKKEEQSSTKLRSRVQQILCVILADELWRKQQLDTLSDINFQSASSVFPRKGFSRLRIGRKITSY